jgi:hypothetical protein
MKRIAAGALVVGAIAVGAGQAAAGYTAQVQGDVLRINGDSASDTSSSSPTGPTRSVTISSRSRTPWTT